MPSTNGKDRLADTPYMTFIVRLVLNSRRQIVQGELIDVTAETTQRFKNWNGLIRTLSNRCKAKSEQADDIRSQQS